MNSSVVRFVAETIRNNYNELDVLTLYCPRAKLNCYMYSHHKLKLYARTHTHTHMTCRHIARWLFICLKFITLFCRSHEAQLPNKQCENISECGAKWPRQFCWCAKDTNITFASFTFCLCKEIVEILQRGRKSSEIFRI